MRNKAVGFPSLMFLLCLLCLICINPAEAKNPFTSYFSRFLDESRAEIAVGNILFDTFVAESGGTGHIATYPELDQLAGEIGKNCPRNNLVFKVFVLDNPIPGEIPFPGGIIVLTKGTKEMIQSDSERNFIIARNVMHIALRHPMNMLKKEGLYAKLLHVLKTPSSKTSPDLRRTIIRDYAKAVPGMDQLKADREAINLYGDPRTNRQAAVAFLKRLSETLWPTMPWDYFDIPTRIQALEALPLN